MVAAASLCALPEMATNATLRNVFEAELTAKAERLSNATHTASAALRVMDEVSGASGGASFALTPFLG